MKPLHGRTCYLSAPIECDTGVNWRPAIKEELTRKFGIKIHDPFDDPKQSKVGELTAAKEAGDFNKIAEIAEGFVQKDLGLVDRVDFLIAHLPYRVPTVGTIHEIVNGINRKIPTLLVCPQGRMYLSSWFYGVLRKKHDRYMHGSWESLFNYLEEVNDKKHTDDRRWFYVYDMI